MTISLKCQPKTTTARFKNNKSNQAVAFVVSLYICQSDYVTGIDEMVDLIDDGHIAPAFETTDYELEERVGREVVTLTVYMETYSVIYTAIVSEDGEEIALNETQIYSTDSIAVYDHIFTLYTR